MLFSIIKVLALIMFAIIVIWFSIMMVVFLKYVHFVLRKQKVEEELTKSELPQDLVKLQLKTLIEEDDCEEST